MVHPMQQLIWALILFGVAGVNVIRQEHFKH
jgi:hypothetical protein